MAGHSKWAQIKHKKALSDAKKSQMFAKLAALITVAAREKGGDPNANPKLRFAIEKARSLNMPQENIERAIKRGTGELPGTAIEEALYEGYGPAGIAILVEVITDNKNRTLGELRHIFAEHGGKLGGPGSAAWLFDRTPSESGVEYIAKAPVAITDPATAKALEALFNALDEHPDVKEIYSNASLPQ
jgi:YebC/PmpR family DNA-binding regulatory protein